VWTLEEFVQKAKLVHDLQSRGMNGVAPKVAQKIAVLFEDQYIHACPREQET
jgi:hypothetical protein